MIQFPGKLTPHVPSNMPNETYAYTFRGQVVDLEENGIDLKAIFDPEIFFNIILPPIIFYAGYSLKRVGKKTINTQISIIKFVSFGNCLLFHSIPFD